MGLLDDLYSTELGAIRAVPATTRANYDRLKGLLGVDSTGNGLLSDLGYGARNALSQAKWNAGNRLDKIQQYLTDPSARFQPSTPESRASIDEALMSLGSSVMPGAMAGMVIPKKAQMEMLQKLSEMRLGNDPHYIVKQGFAPTSEQLGQINNAYSELTGGRQPPFEKNAIDINLKHIFDSRMSGAEKASGKKGDSFTEDEVVPWMVSAGDDLAKVGTRNGKPFMQNVYMDPKTGQSIPVEMPISGDYLTGNLWISGIVPKGKYSGEKP